MATEYFQIGGYMPHVQWHQPYQFDDRLSQIIWDPSSPLRRGKPTGSPLELILGITPRGSSHLLLTADQAHGVASHGNLRYPGKRPDQRTSRDCVVYQSLSPIYFASVEDLEKKLRTLKPKAKKGKPGDTSQANRGYLLDTIDLSRGAFEHGRVLYRLLREEIRPTMYSVEPPSWMGDIEIASFVFNTKGVDDRLAEERIKTPHVLDVGFCRATLPNLDPALGSAQYIIPGRNALLGRKEKKETFKHGETKAINTADPAALPRAIQELFQGCKSPLVLLVNNKEETLNYLRNMGVNTSEWQDGLTGLLYNQNFTTGNDFQSNAAPRYNNYRDGRDRSRSPGRGFDYNHNRHASNSRSQPYQEPRRRHRLAPVYVVDVRRSYKTLMESDNAKTPVEIAVKLRLPDVEAGWWCAGNEAPLLIDIWRSMVAGAAIDEQRQQRQPIRDPAAGPSESLPGDAPEINEGAPEDEDSDEERDPNVSVVQAQIANKPGQVPEPVDILDVSDYGDSSDDSD
ncbi:hypothetical protein HYPSUDRAFT_47237 [Hypholoma sublateritium FD-334 SS-4]|uniref:Uncharacterized protein n=1 Tax=Hypholoma sublateritium (strain FD-334 SS-4) TaxID=945553 RepID=A0A0D2NBV9_HYPSF|nr:hypothetical protein HYPSUDRAFT_47237 [Hypholoma sublateritium FD-334 SS-4]